jgi:hypothetical protein
MPVLPMRRAGGYNRFQDREVSAIDSKFAGRTLGSVTICAPPADEYPGQRSQHTEARLVEKQNYRTISLMTAATESNIVLKTCELIVAHFKNLLELNTYGFNSRIFEHMLHPEQKFVFAGTSTSVREDTPTHPEHVVPCAMMITECKRMLEEQRQSQTEVARLLAKHWKVAIITKEEQRRLDFDLGLKSSMPAGWTFEEGDTFARLNVAGISLNS